MFISKKIKIIKESKNKRFIINRFVGRVLDGRISLLSDGSRNSYQVKHPNYSNWFDVPKEIIEVQ